MYDAKNAIEIEDKTMLPVDAILDAVIIQVEDGIVSDFVKNTSKWEWDIGSPAINLVLEVKANDEMKKIEQLYTYKVDNKQTAYTPRSNLGKYVAKYKKLPEVGDQVKIITNKDGFGKIKIE